MPTYAVTGDPVVVDSLASASIQIQNTGPAPILVSPTGLQLVPGATATVPGWSQVPTRLRTAGQPSTAVVTLTAGSPAARPGPGGVTFYAGDAATMQIVALSSADGISWFANEHLTTPAVFPVSVAGQVTLWPDKTGSVTVTATSGALSRTGGMRIDTGSEESWTFPTSVSDAPVIAAAQAIAAGSGAFAPASGLNLQPANLRGWRKGLARVRSGGGDAKILCLGDSTTAGVGVAASTNQGDSRSYPYCLAATLNGRIPAIAGLGIPGHVANLDSRWVRGTGWTNDVIGAGANSGYKYTSGGGALTFTPGVLADSYDVYFISTPGGGTGSAVATGGTPVAINYNQANLVRKVTVAAASASTSNTVSITGAGLGFIVGIEPFLATQKQVRVGNAGCGSSTTTQWASNPGGIVAWGSVGLITSYAPDLTVISMGLNEATAANTTLYTTNLQTLITAAQLSGDVLLMPPIPNAASMPSATVAKSAGVAAFTATCRAFGLPYAALDDRWVSGDQANADGYMWDYQHPDEAGYADIAQMLANILLSA